MSMHTAHRSLAAFVLILAALTAAACGSRAVRLPPGAFEADKVLFERGTAALNERRWYTAREYFRQIVDGYPQSEYRAHAKLGLGDTYLGESTPESFVLAINEYREFLNFFPTHARADYAQFKLAMSYYYQMPKAERDQTHTKEALEEFDVFFERFPNSALMPEAKTRWREARDRLSESEYKVGLFYYRARWYPGAIDRFKAVLKDDPSYTHRDAVYYYLGESLVKVKLEAEALPLFEKLVAEFVQSEHLEAARQRVEELKAQLAANPKPEATPPKPPSGSEREGPASPAA